MDFHLIYLIDNNNLLYKKFEYQIGINNFSRWQHLCHLNQTKIFTAFSLCKRMMTDLIDMVRYTIYLMFAMDFS